MGGSALPEYYIGSDRHMCEQKNRLARRLSAREGGRDGRPRQPDGHTKSRPRARAEAAALRYPGPSDERNTYTKRATVVMGCVSQRLESRTPHLGSAAPSVIQGPECVAPSQKSFKMDQARAGGLTEGGYRPLPVQFTARLV